MRIFFIACVVNLLQLHERKAHCLSHLPISRTIMFIPTWLIVLVAIVTIVAFLPSIWEALRVVAITGYVLLVLLSFAATLYFVSQGDRETAWVVSIPLLPVVAWLFWTDLRKGIRTSQWLHQFRVKAAGTPESVERLRRR